MIFIDLRDKVDSNALSKYYSILTDKMDDEKKKQIEKWCQDYLRKDNGEPYSFEEVVKADYSELQKLKKQIDDNHLDQYNCFLYNHNKVYKAENKKRKRKKKNENEKKRNSCYYKC